MLPNLTPCNEAIERAALVTVDNYTIVPDLTASETTFRSTTTVEFQALPGADTYLDLAADAVHSAVLNGHAIDVSGYDESTGIPLRGLAKRNTLVVEADCRFSNTGEGLIASSIPSTARSICTRSSKPPTPRDVRLLRPARYEGQLRHHGHRARALAGDLQRRPPSAEENGRSRSTFAHHPADEHLPGRADRRPYARWDDTAADEHGEIPLGLFCRSSLAEFADAERLFTETKRGSASITANFGVPYAFGKYDQLFVPEFNAGRWRTPGR